MRKGSFILYGATLLIVAASWSCGNSKVKPQDFETSIIDSNTKQDLYVWVENARLRKEPNLESEIITEIKGGEKISLTGEETKDKTKTKLRGVDFEDVWVKAKTADGKEGWIFKGMLSNDPSLAANMNVFDIVPGRSVGKINIGDRKDDVVKIYGAMFVKDGDIYFAEGNSLAGFYVFKDSPMEVECILDEKTGKISMIFLRQPNSNWVMPQTGVKVGMKLDDLAVVNKKPITFSGFGWDFGGQILSFNSGDLSVYDAGMSISLAEPDNLEGMDDFIGDKECSTKNKAALNKGIKVAEIAIVAEEAL